MARQDNSASLIRPIASSLGLLKVRLTPNRAALYVWSICSPVTVEWYTISQSLIHSMPQTLFDRDRAVVEERLG